MSDWGVAPGIRLSRKPSAEGALQFRAGGFAMIQRNDGRTQSRLQRWCSLGASSLGRCSRLPVNAAPLALNAYWPRAPCQPSLSLVPRFLLERNPPGSLLERFEVIRILLIIFLVIRLRRIKFHRRQNFSYDWFVEFAGVRQLLS